VFVVLINQSIHFSGVERFTAILFCKTYKDPQASKTTTVDTKYNLLYNTFLNKGNDMKRSDKR
jgi:hypothetical protein